MGLPGADSASPVCRADELPPASLPGRPRQRLHDFAGGQRRRSCHVQGAKSMEPVLTGRGWRRSCAIGFPRGTPARRCGEIATATSLNQYYRSEANRRNTGCHAHDRYNSSAAAPSALNTSAAPYPNLTGGVSAAPDALSGVLPNMFMLGSRQFGCRFANVDFPFSPRASSRPVHPRHDNDGRYRHSSIPSSGVSPPARRARCGRHRPDAVGTTTVGDNVAVAS